MLLHIPNVLTHDELRQARQLLADGTLAGEKIAPRCWLIDADSVSRYAASDRKPGPKPVKNS